MFNWKSQTGFVCPKSEVNLFKMVLLSNFLSHLIHTLNYVFACHNLEEYWLCTVSYTGHIAYYLAYNCKITHVCVYYVRGKKDLQIEQEKSPKIFISHLMYIFNLVFASHNLEES